jgi:putative transposase
LVLVGSAIEQGGVAVVASSFFVWQPGATGVKRTKTKAAEQSTTALHTKRDPEGFLMAATDPNLQRLQLIERLLHLPAERLGKVERFLESLHTTQVSQAADSASTTATRSDWPHAPLHRISDHGTYIVTAATLGSLHHFRGAERLDALQNALLTQLQEGGWEVEAWAVFSNHYHFVAHARRGSTLLDDLLTELHRSTALHVNQLDAATNRQVWFQFWETELTCEASYLARLNYVHQNAVKHRLVPVANQYRWCSAAWFERTATPAQVKTIYRLKTDRLRIEDDFEPV